MAGRTRRQAHRARNKKQQLEGGPTGGVEGKPGRKVEGRVEYCRRERNLEKTLSDGKSRSLLPSGEKKKKRNGGGVHLKQAHSSSEKTSYKRGRGKPH